MMRKLLVAGLGATLAVTGSITAFAYPAGNNFDVETVRTNVLPRTLVKARALNVYPGCEVEFGFDELRDTRDEIDSDYDKDSAIASKRGRTGYVNLSAPKFAGAYQVVAKVETECEAEAGTFDESTIYVGVKSKVTDLALAFVKTKKSLTVTGKLKTAGDAAIAGRPLVIKLYKDNSLVATASATTTALGAFTLADTKTYASLKLLAAGNYKATVSMAPNTTNFLISPEYTSPVVAAQ